MVDSADKDRFVEAKKELTSVLTDERLAHVPVAVLANKCDRKEAIPVDDVAKALELPARAELLQIFECSVTRGIGYEEAFRWLSSHIG